MDNNIIYNDEKINMILLFFCGLFSTMPIITLSFANHMIPLFSATIIILLFLFLLNNISKSRKSILYSNTLSVKLYFLWLLWALFSSISGIFYYYNEPLWQRQVVTYIPKIMIYLLFGGILFSQKHGDRAVMKGIIAGTVLNICWAIADAVGFYITRISLTNTLFKSYIAAMNIRHGQISLISYDGYIRSSGFNYDPAHIGMLAPILFSFGIFQKKVVYILLALLSLVASLSTTAVVGCVAALLVWLCLKGFNEHTYIYRFHTKKKLIMSGMFLAASIILAVYFGGIISKAFQSFVSRISTVYIHGNGEDPRSLYLKYFTTAFLNRGIKCVTGTGFMTSSEGYLGMGQITEVLLNNVPFDMENTYLAYFFDLGIPGFLFYLSLLIYELYCCCKHLKTKRDFYNCACAASIISTIICGLFYHYTLFSAQMMILAACAKERES